MFLTEKELIELTGYHRGHCQCAWLDANNFTFKVRRNGMPAVYRAEFDAVMMSQPITPSNDDDAQMNMAAIG